MISIFKVTDVNFVENSTEKDILRFIPDNKLGKLYKNRELIKRIFTEDIEVNPEPEPVIYPEVIQKLIDADAQTSADVARILSLYDPADISAILQTLINASPQPTTAADIAKILSLYNPADISEILQTLINEDPQPSTVDAVMQSNNILGYPYQNHSVIYDNVYNDWEKLGTGTITRQNSYNEFLNAGVQLSKDLSSSYYPTVSTALTFDIDIQPFYVSGVINQNIIILYNSLATTNSNPPYYILQCRHDTTTATDEVQFRIRKLTTTNGTEEIATLSPIYKTNSVTRLQFIIYDDGSQKLWGTERGAINWKSTEITSTTQFTPKKLRVGFSRSSTATTLNNYFQIYRFKVTDYAGNILSQWNP